MQTIVSLLNDLLVDLPLSIRSQRLVRNLRERFLCDAVGLLQVQGETLVPMAFVGLAKEAMGRRFVIAQHPRLEAVMRSQTPVRFVPGDPRPDPYDGLVAEYLGEPLPVHDCMGIRLSFDGDVHAVLTLDALEGRTFTDKDVSNLQVFAQMAQVMLRVSGLEEDRRRFNQQPVKLNVSTALNGRVERPVITGQSPVMKALLQSLAHVADSDLPLLLLGESGTGKKQLAQLIHHDSGRSGQPMVHVHCAALSNAVVADTELFGRAEGDPAFVHAGRLEQAQGGTLFLEEIDALPLATQAKLLRFFPGNPDGFAGSGTSPRVNVRFLASGQRDVVQSVRDGRLLPALSEQFLVNSLRVPALRDRGADVMLLAGRFLELHRAQSGLHGLRLSEQAQRALFAYSWPGNVRELRSVLARAMARILSQNRKSSAIVTLDVDDLGLGTVQPLSPKGQTTAMSLRRATDVFQRQMVQAALAQNHNNWSAAARGLDVDTSNLHKLAKRLGLKSSG